MTYFFIGIKGSGMSSLALILKDLGNTVLGSDENKPYFTEKKLKEQDIAIYNFGEYSFSENIDSENIDCVILGNAFNKEHVDYINAKKKNLEIITYSQMLNKLANQYESIAISGTNGKTTTTGLLKSSLVDEKFSYLIGDGTGAGIKNSKYFLFEACEYKETFLNYHPHIGLINNIEFDHPDYFRDLDHVIEVFQKFANQNKILVINGDSKHCQEIKHENKYTFGIGERNDLRVTNIVYNQNGIKFNLIFQKKDLGEFQLPFFGEHMLYNSLGVILINLVLKRNIKEVIKNLTEFQGVQRRFSETKINTNKEIVLIDDYAHHATAIDLTIKAIRQKYPQHELTVLFQPHTFSRTKVFKKEFAQSLVNSDKILLVDVFGSAREKESDITSDVIKKEIIKLDAKQKLIEFSDISSQKKQQVICILGAGDIDLIYKDKIKNLFLGE